MKAGRSGGLLPTVPATERKTAIKGFLKGVGYFFFWYFLVNLFGLFIQDPVATRILIWVIVFGAIPIHFGFHSRKTGQVKDKFVFWGYMATECVFIMFVLALSLG